MTPTLVTHPDMAPRNATTLLVFRHSMHSAIKAALTAKTKAHQRMFEKGAYAHARACGREALKMLSHYEAMVANQ